MKIIFFGTPDFVLPVLEALTNHGTVIGVVTAPDVTTGRKKVLTPSPVKQYAIEHNIPTVLTPDKLTKDMSISLQKLSPDLFVVAAYGKIIPLSLLTIPTFGALNLHPSLLPKYRGPSPIQTALKNGDHETGISIIKMDEKMDHGPPVYQESFPLTDQDTFASLHQRMFERAATILPDIIVRYTSGQFIPQEQNHANATYCQMITKQDGFIDSTAPPDPKTLDQLIRAYYPWPTAWTKWQMANGKWQIVKLLPKGNIQLEGGRPTTIKDILNGHPELREILVKMGLEARN